MARTIVSIPDELLEQSRIEALKRKISFAQLVREQLVKYFEEAKGYDTDGVEGKV